NESGRMEKGWKYIGSDWYYLNPNSGYMEIGWVNDNGTWYFTNESGRMQKGWKYIGAHWYYFNQNSGYMHTGWITVDGIKYFMNSNGQLSETNNSATNTSDSKRQEIVNEAKKHIGKPYVYGATGPNSFDCSGLTQYVYKQVGHSLDRTTQQQVKNGSEVSKEQLLPGDLVFTEGSKTNPTHVGIYIGNNKMIHCPKPGKTVEEINLYKFITGRRIIK
ncbi:MAG: NlpC/P60 family protein, partial [Sarcina sp.]